MRHDREAMGWRLKWHDKYHQGIDFFTNFEMSRDYSIHFFVEQCSWINVTSSAFNMGGTS